MPGFAQAAERIVATGRWLDGKGWAPATAGNYSMRLDDRSIAITVSGWHKGRLNREGVMRVALDGTPLEDKRPSAETGLHLQLYRRFEQVNAVLHSHSPEAVGLSRAHPLIARWRFAGHEMLKVIPGFSTHEDAFDLPIVDNSQHIPDIEAAIAPWLERRPAAAYLIRGHGLYGWGRSIEEAERVIEGVEWLIAAELAERGWRARA
ncbi:MAG: methylthioribulose 1-phosphate dehydratase [Sphingomonadaceae bacterium]|nr:methylthioribulose 1-phosphate dehydratase [Sphingomonadaceae bacterium]